MTKIMHFLYLILLPTLLVSACSSGVTQSKAGGAGSNTGSTGLLAFGTVEPNPTISNAVADCTPVPTAGAGGATATGRGDGINDTARQPVVGTLTATVQDPRGIYAFPFQPQGVTYDSYTITYTGVTTGAPSLTPKNFRVTINISLGGVATPVTVTDSIILMDLQTLAEYASKDSGSPNTYTLRITYRGRDFINGEPITMVINHQVQVGGFCGTSELPP